MVECEDINSNALLSYRLQKKTVYVHTGRRAGSWRVMAPQYHLLSEDGDTSTALSHESTHTITALRSAKKNSANQARLSHTRRPPLSSKPVLVHKSGVSRFIHSKGKAKPPLFRDKPGRWGRRWLLRVWGDNTRFRGQVGLAICRSPRISSVGGIEVRPY